MKKTILLFFVVLFKVKIPASAQGIDGAGKYLIPGLTDMHTRLFTDDEFPDSLVEDGRE